MAYSQRSGRLLAAEIESVLQDQEVALAIGKPRDDRRQVVVLDPGQRISQIRLWRSG